MSADTKLIVNLTRGTPVCETEVADRPLTRMRGLLGRDGIARGHGMLIRPAPSIHTAFMRFPIDALFLDEDMTVLGISAELAPWRIASERRARSVLEMAAGETARLGVRVGDQLSLRDRWGRSIVAAGRRALAERRGDRETNGTSVEASPVNGAGSESATRGEVARIRPLSVLVVSPDRRFRSVTSVLIARRGCAVTTTENASRLTELADRIAADVVVVDVDNGSRAAERARARVRGYERPLGLVLVDDEPIDAAGVDSPPLSKWGPFDRLYAAIEAADVRRVNGAHDDGR